MDTVNNQVSFKYLYKENLKELGENYNRAIKRTKTLHNKMSDKPDIATEIDKYIQEQINKGNYKKIDIEEARKENQLHFVGYNFVVSATSSSTKVRITTDSPWAPSPASASMRSPNLPLETSQASVES